MMRRAAAAMTPSRMVASSIATSCVYSSSLGRPVGGGKGVVMNASLKSAKQPGVAIKDVRLGVPPAQAKTASDVSAMPNAKGADDRITKLCTLVTRTALAAWIGGPDKFFKVLPEPSEAQSLLLGTDKVDVVMSLTSLLTTCGVVLRAESRRAIAAELVAMPPTRVFPNGFWYEYPIDAILDKCPTITSTIKVGITSSVRFVGKWESHRCVESRATDEGVAQQIVAALREFLTVIVYGESGSGKTTGMLLAAVVEAAQMNRKLTPFALYTALSDKRKELQDIEDVVKSTSDTKKEACKLPAQSGWRVHPLDGVEWNDACRCTSCRRDHLAAQLLVTICKGIHTPWTARLQSTAVQPHHAVVVLDELGSFPGFVRAVCALGQPFRDALAAHLNMERVSIVMGGTGSETPDMSPGSLPTSFRMVHATTKLWPELVKSNALLEPFEKMMRPPNTGKRDVRSVSVKLAHDLSSNARAAALLATALNDMCTTVPAGDAQNYGLLFGMAVLRTAFQYKQKNGLNELEPEEHSLLVLSAIAASHFLPCNMELVPLSDAKLSPTMHSSVMVDRAKVKELATGGRQMTLETKFCNRRFEVSAAQVAVLKLLMDTATRDVSADGFELSMGDFMLFALMLAKGRPGDIINRADGVVRTSSAAVASPSATRFPLPKVATDFPARWISLQDFICTLAKDFEGLPHRPTTVRFLKGKITTDPKSLRNADAGMVALTEFNAGEDVICVNGDKASFADIVVFAHGLNGKKVVFLIQCKRYLKDMLPSASVEEELEKMGFDANGNHPIAKQWQSVIGRDVEYRFVVVVYGARPGAIPRKWANRKGVHYVACKTGKFFLVDVQPKVENDHRKYDLTPRTIVFL